MRTGAFLGCRNSERTGEDLALRKSEFRKWIPDFRYELVSINKLSNQEFLERGDEISLIILSNRMQNAADSEKFLRILADKLEPIIKGSPDQVMDVMVMFRTQCCAD